ncbi:MAG: response regulator [Lachnotalea sp.]
MKLLIIDDEELTRDGLIHSINWKSLGIDSIYQADDGLNGFELAKQQSPEIILSDVRMPRMDGIEMAHRIREISPECSIIFMSGYSDKSYLKAAIKLKAISYVEKPINPSEIEDSVKEAIANHKLLILNKQSVDNSKHDALSKFALSIIYSNHSSDISYVDTFSSLGFSPKNTVSYTTLIIKIIDNSARILDVDISNIIASLESTLNDYDLDYIYGVKQEEYIICHLFSHVKLDQNSLVKLSKKFSTSISNYCSHYISIGKSVNSIHKIYESYNLAIVQMHSSFFYPFNSILFQGTENKYNTVSIPCEMISDFSEALLQRNKNKVTKLLDHLKEILINNRSILVNHVKDVYYKLFLELTESANNFHISISTDSTESILGHVSKSSTIFELHSTLEDKINTFFQSFEDVNRDNSTVFMIKEYISQNYHNEGLSIKDISDHVFLSSSYVCTVFKTETNKTLNQYLTEYRIEKAKKLLMDSRYKITDISSKVGYNDGNYFGKSFKKLVGFSPSEFREQYLEGNI